MHRYSFHPLVIYACREIDLNRKFDRVATIMAMAVTMTMAIGRRQPACLFDEAFLQRMGRPQAAFRPVLPGQVLMGGTGTGIRRCPQPR